MVPFGSIEETLRVYHKSTGGDVQTGNYGAARYIRVSGGLDSLTGSICVRDRLE